MNLPKNFLRDLAASLLFIIGWVGVVSTVMSNLGWWPPHSFGFSAPPQGFGWYIFFCCILAPLWEEGIFRYGVFKFFPKVANLPKIVVSSIIFGLMHRSDLIAHGLLIQGVMGMVFAIMYIRYGYKGSVATHSLWNFMCLIL